MNAEKETERGWKKDLGRERERERKGGWGRGPNFMIILSWFWKIESGLRINTVS